MLHRTSHFDTGAHCPGRAKPMSLAQVHLTFNTGDRKQRAVWNNKYAIELIHVQVRDELTRQDQEREAWEGRAA